MNYILKLITILFRKNRITGSIFLVFMTTVVLCKDLMAQHADTTFKWPDGKQTAISLTFDDARFSQVDTGTALLDSYGIKATFFVVPSNLEERLEGWKKAVAKGHEIGNHTMHHPCTGNFLWSRENALENYTLDDMRHELFECNKRVKELLGV